MEETEFAGLLVEAYLEERLENNLAQLSEYCTKNTDQILKSLLDNFKMVLAQGILLQKNGQVGEFKYLAISFLRSLIMEKDYRLRLDLYDASYFLSKVECSGYLELGYIWKYLDGDLEALLGELRECGAKYASYEIDEMKKEYLMTYVPVIQLFLLENLEAILSIPEFAELQKTADFKIIYGEYLDQTQIIYDAQAPESEGA